MLFDATLKFCSLFFHKLGSLKHTNLVKNVQNVVLLDIFCVIFSGQLKYNISMTSYYIVTRVMSPNSNSLNSIHDMIIGIHFHMGYNK